MTSIFGMESFEDTKNINPIVKIASFEINYFELFQEIIKKRKPIIISSGCSYENEIKKTVNFFKKKNYKKFALMHCGSDYPLQFRDANLNYIKKMKKLFPNTVIGYSDHTLNISSCIAAVSLGAKIIEKHFTISQKDRAPDSFFSLEKKELKELIKNVREIEKSLGQDKKIISKKILRMRNAGMRSYYSTENFNKGVLIKKGMFKALRPHAKKTIAIDDFKIILNKKLRKNISKNEPLKKEHIY